MEYDNDDETISGIDLLKVIDDTVVVAIGIAFITHGFLISKYNIHQILRRVIYYTIFVVLYRQYVSNTLAKILNKHDARRFRGSSPGGLKTKTA